MSAEDIALTLVAVFVFALIIIAANRADQRRNEALRRAVTAVLALLNLLIVVVYGFFPALAAVLPEDSLNGVNPPTTAEGIGALIGALAVGGLATALLYRPVRGWLARFFPPYRGGTSGTAPQPPAEIAAPPAPVTLTPRADGQPLFPQMLNYYTADAEAPYLPAASAALTPSEPAEADPRTGIVRVRGFNPDSAVHMTALVSCVYLLGVQFINFILGGGLQGVAQSFSGKLTVFDLVVNALPLLILPVLGVGFAMRRDVRGTLRRLGITMPSVADVGIAGAVTIGLFVFVSAMSFIWQQSVSEETFKEQTQASDALAESVTSVGIALLLAALAAVSEEIAFRGALQPVLGFWPTAVIFALTHLQYTLTPASVIIFGVAIAFGWLRQHYSTTVSMITHFLYNFIPLAVSVSVSQEAFHWLLRLLG